MADHVIVHDTGNTGSDNSAAMIVLLVAILAIAAFAFYAYNSNMFNAAGTRSTEIDVNMPAETTPSAPTAPGATTPAY